ncbi:MAG TPA: outer membrane protein transport protein [Gammaproteobacteria bacterium]|nr:outer membrane protein transport protein [Gammaproteobacteria bacterium]
MARNRHFRALRQYVVAGLLAGTSAQAFAAGFAIHEQSASDLGNAFAGGAALAQDASTTFFNPAGLTRLPANQLVAGVHFLHPSIEFTDKGSTDLLGQPLSGGDGGDAGGTLTVPDFYYAHRLNRRMVVAVGVNAPFGLRTQYDPHWVGRYQAIKSDLRTVNINPSLAYRINDRLSVGAGLNAQYIRATLTRAVDYGGLCVAQGIQAGQTPSAAAAACAAAGLVPQHSDGTAHVAGNDWSYGVNLGLLYQLDPGTRFGAAYRFRVDHTLTGRATFTGAPALFTAKGVFVPAAARASIDLPETLSMSAYHALNSRWAVMGDVTWTHWSRFKELRVAYASNQQDTVTKEHWRNSLRYALGANYRYNSRWLLRAGVAYDQTPIPDAAHRTARIPGNNRTWLAAGFHYQPAPAVGIDVGYAHLFVTDTAIDHHDAKAGTLTGSYATSVDIFSGQVTWTF